MKEKFYRVCIMQIDYALILSAGMGTRMGEIGKKLPKPLWPIFSKTLLELQVDFCLEIGIKKIFINTHFLSEEIKLFIKSSSKFEKIIQLHEEMLLDSGGAIHNMASRGDVNYSGNVLLLNADQFLFFDKSVIDESVLDLVNNRAVLFGINVDKSEKYNELIISNGKLVEISKPSGIESFVTYSGLGLLKLDGLLAEPGGSKFFDSVANFKKEFILVRTPGLYEYWDFGTADHYFNNIMRLFSENEGRIDSLANRFFKKHDAINDNINKYVSLKLNSINIKGENRFKLNSIVFGDIEQVLVK